MFNSLALSNLLSLYSHSRYPPKGKMKRILRSYWLPERATWTLSPREISHVGPERTKLIWSKSTSVCESKLLAHCPVLNALLKTVYYASKTRY